MYAAKYDKAVEGKVNKVSNKLAIELVEELEEILAFAVIERQALGKLEIESIKALLDKVYNSNTLK